MATIATSMAIGAVVGGATGGGKGAVTGALLGGVGGYGAGSLLGGTTASGAATSGLFGTGGSFGLMTTLSNLGTVASVAGMVSSAGTSKELAQYNQKVYQAQAKTIEYQKDITKRRYAVQRSGLISAAIVQSAASGVKFSGSPIEVLNRNLTELGIDESVDLLNLETGRAKAQSSANIAKYRGQDAYRANMINAGTTLLTKGSDFYNKYWS
jgi:hypothetical protein